jgi:GDP-L-fucose synthase
MKKVLITGCNGLVGSYLRDLCLDRGWEVVGVDRNPTKRISRNFNYRFKKIDLLIEQNIVDLFKEEKYDAVFNCFGIKGSPIKAKNNPVDFLYPSFKINTEIINQCYLNDTWLVFVSSVGVYSPAEKFSEDEVWKTLPSESDWFPSWSKRMGELLLESYRVQYGYKKWTIVRPANIFGEYDDFSGSGTLISTMVKKVYESSGEIEAWGDGTPIRDFVYGKDVALSLIKLYEKGINDIINCGSGIEVSIKDVVNEIIKASGKDITVKWDPSKPNGDLRRLMDTDRQEIYGIMPETKFEDAIKNVYNYYTKSIKGEDPIIPVSDLLTEGAYLGKISDFLEEDELEKFKEMIESVKEYSSEDIENRLLCRYNYDDIKNPYDHAIPPSKVPERDAWVRKNNYHVWQKWWEFKYPDQEYFDKIAIKILKILYPQTAEYLDNPDNVDFRGNMALFEDGHYIDIHNDGANAGRLCVIIFYLSDEKTYHNGGGQLKIITNSGKEHLVDPFFDNFCVMDFARNNIKHEVKMVNNGFKRYTYINFLKFEDSSILENIFPPVDGDPAKEKLKKKKII